MSVNRRQTQLKILIVSIITMVPIVAYSFINLPQSTASQAPNFSEIRDIKKKKQQFFNFMLQPAEFVNEQVLQERHKLEAIAGKIKLAQSLSHVDTAWVRRLSEKYGVNALDEFDLNGVKKLLERVDVIPSALVLAQAANESAWGTSRFAVKANNYFGQWCFQAGCGIVPTQRAPGEHYEVAAFDDAYQSVERYVHNLNSHAAYQKLRKIRSELRQKQQPLDSTLLATGLESYSSRGLNYVTDIQKLIRSNQLEKLDTEHWLAAN